MSDAVPAPTATRSSLKSSHAYTFAQPRASQQSAFFDLTDELKASVLSYLPAPTVVGVCRATCQELFNFINGHENKIAHTMQKRELRRLQARSDKLKSFGPPTSVMEFVEGLRLFTKQRGIVTMQEHESRVAAKWIRHLFRNKFPYEENPTSPDDKWAVLATDFLQIQRAFDDDVRRGMPKRDCYQKLTLMIRHWDTVSRHQIMEVYGRMRAAPANQPCFPGMVHGHDVAERDTWPELRLTMTYDGKRCFHPVVPYELVHLLDLPKLPQSKTFFYYVEEEWVCREIERVPRCPMLKAAILQLVKIF